MVIRKGNKGIESMFSEHFFGDHPPYDQACAFSASTFCPQHLFARARTHKAGMLMYSAAAAASSSVALIEAPLGFAD